MKKITLFFITAIFISCMNKSPSSNNKVIEPVVVDGITCEYTYGNGSYDRIITSEIISDTLVLRKILNQLPPKENIIYFNIPELTEPGEEYAYLMGMNLITVENPPKNKEEALLLKKISQVKSAIVDLNIIPLNDLKFETITIYLDNIEVASKTYLRYQNETDQGLKKELTSLRQKLVSTQKTAFPRMRKIFADNLKQKLWVDDIKVSQSGTTITFTGYQFATNRNIKEGYEAISDLLRRLRFKRANFRWSEYGEYTYYTIETPSDQEIQ